MENSIDSLSLNEIARIVARRIAHLHEAGRAYENKGGKSAPPEERILANPTGSGIPLSNQDLLELQAEALAALLEAAGLDFDDAKAFRFASNRCRRALYQRLKSPVFDDEAQARKQGARAHRLFITQLEEEAEAEGRALAEEAFDAFSAREESSPRARYASALRALSTCYAFADYSRAKKDLREARGLLRALAEGLQSGARPFSFNRKDKESEAFRKRLEKLARKIARGRELMEKFPRFQAQARAEAREARKRAQAPCFMEIETSFNAAEGRFSPFALRLIKQAEAREKRARKRTLKSLREL